METRQPELFTPMGSKGPDKPLEMRAVRIQLAPEVFIVEDEEDEAEVFQVETEELVIVGYINTDISKDDSSKLEVFGSVPLVALKGQVESSSRFIASHTNNYELFRYYRPSDYGHHQGELRRVQPYKIDTGRGSRKTVHLTGKDFPDGAEVHRFDHPIDFDQRAFEAEVSKAQE